MKKNIKYDVVSIVCCFPATLQRCSVTASGEPPTQTLDALLGSLLRERTAVHPQLAEPHAQSGSAMILGNLCSGPTFECVPPTSAPWPAALPRQCGARSNEGQQVATYRNRAL